MILVEKPFCKPDLENAMELFNKAKSRNIKIFVGFNHVVGKAASKIKSILENETIGKIQTLDVEFREHWVEFFQLIIGSKALKTVT